MIKNIQLMSGCLAMMICAVLLAQPTAWSALRVSPTQQNLKISPGNTETIQLRLSNSSRTDKLHLHIYVTDYNIRQNGSPAFPNANATKDSLASWVKIKDANVVLNPGERRIVPIKYTVPKRATGERYGAIMVEKDPVPYKKKPGDESNNKLSGIISVSYRIACTVVLSIDGTKFLKQGSVTNVAVNIPTSDSWMETQKIEVMAIFKNEGNIHISPRRGEALIVHKGLRKVVARIPLTTPRNPNIFPGATRSYKGYIEEPLRPGEYAVQAKFNVGSGSGHISRVNSEFTITRELSEEMNRIFHGNSGYSGPTIIGADPQVVEVKVPVGGYRSSAVTVNNQHDEPIQVQSYIKDLQFQPDGEMQIMEAGTIERSCADWISIQPAKFYLQPGASKKIILRVRIPDGADGGHYGKLVFETTPFPPNTSSHAEMETSLGSTLMVVIPGTSKLKGVITNFVSSPLENGKLPEFTIGFNNTGNMHMRPTCKIMIKDYMGDIVHEQSFGKNVPFILPGNTRQIKAVYNGEKLPEGKYTAIVIINYGDEAGVKADCEFTITDKPTQVAANQKMVKNI